MLLRNTFEDDDQCCYRVYTMLMGGNPNSENEVLSFKHQIADVLNNLSKKEKEKIPLFNAKRIRCVRKWGYNKKYSANHDTHFAFAYKFGIPLVVLSFADKSSEKIVCRTYYKVFVAFHFICISGIYCFILCCYNCHFGYSSVFCYSQGEEQI